MIDIQLNFEKNKYKREVNQIINKKYLSKYILKRFIKCEKLESKTINLNYNFVSEDQQIKINREFKAHDYNTDIITFNVSNDPCELTADVYISLKQVKKNAEKYKVSLNSEMNRVLIHGFLHLVGFNDETNLEKREMRKQENKFLNYINKKFHVEH